MWVREGWGCAGGQGKGNLSIVSFLLDLTHKPLPFPELQDSCFEELTMCEKNI